VRGWASGFGGATFKDTFFVSLIRGNPLKLWMSATPALVRNENGLGGLGASLRIGVTSPS
jgi:hypothetical protein